MGVLRGRVGDAIEFCSSDAEAATLSNDKTVCNHAATTSAPRNYLHESKLDEHEMGKQTYV